MAPDAAAALAVREKVQLFLNAARTGNLDLIKNLAGQLGDGNDLAKTIEDVKDANNRGALHFAAIEGKTEICNYLLKDLKLQVDTRDEDGETPLIHAARKGHTETAKFLLDHGSDPSIASNLGATALHHAAGIGDIELMKYLISKGVNIDSESESGTPLVWGAGHAQPDAVKVLLENKANPNAETEDEITPLLSSVAAGSLPCLRLLTQAGAKINISAGGATPLHIAADNGIVEIINCLLKAGADPNATDEEGTKPILVAAGRGNRDAVEVLFPLTSKIENVPKWTVDGILEYMNAETSREQEEWKRQKEANKQKEPMQDLPQVTPEAKKNAAEAKSRGHEAFKRNELDDAVNAYTQTLKSSVFIYRQAIEFDPTEAALFSNRSLCWLRLGQPELAVADAKTCRALRPDWPKACYREGAALCLLQNFEEAANAFYEGVTLDPNSRELVDAFREAVEAGRKFHGTDKMEKEKS